MKLNRVEWVSQDVSFCFIAGIKVEGLAWVGINKNRVPRVLELGHFSIIGVDQMVDLISVHPFYLVRGNSET